MAQLIPARIPAIPAVIGPPPPPSAPAFSLYDVAIGGIGFFFSSTPQDPMFRETAPYEKPRIDQAKDAGEQTLSSWWIKSQASFHGGAGQLELEPAFPTPFDEVRFDQCKNADVFTPGRVRRLPDTTVLTNATVTKVVGVVAGGVDAVGFIGGGSVSIIKNLTTTPTVSVVSGVSNVVDIATDGTSLYVATTTSVYSVNPTTLAATQMYTYTSDPYAIVGWEKARLMLGTGGGVYQLDGHHTGGSPVGGTELIYQHPVTGWMWRCFGSSPAAIIAAGDAFGVSTLTEFNLQASAGAPTLTVAGEITHLPVGERALSMQNSQGTFLALGTTKGIRIGTFDTYIGALTFGPLILLPTDPVIPANAIALRDRFVFAAGMDYDEGGLICVDLGTKVDNAGRHAWSPHLIAPTATQTAATSVCTLPVSASLVFSIPGVGVLLEGNGPGTNRESWILTSRMRYDTTEPKLFKLGLVRGDLTTGEMRVTAISPYETDVVATVGFTTSDPDQFRLIEGAAEWMQLNIELIGSDVQFTSYQVKSLPGTRRQRIMQFVLALADNETTKTGQRIRDALSSRDRLAALEAIDASGDETILQEYTPQGVISTRVVIEKLSFKQIGRPTSRSDIGGDVTVLLRTVES